MALPNLFNHTTFGEDCDDSPPVLSAPGEPSPQLECVLGNHELTLEVTGGIPPFNWIVTAGQLIIATGGRVATLSIHPTPLEEVNLIHYFKAHVSFFSAICEGHQICEFNDLLETVVDVRLAAYDCMKVHLPFEVNGFPDNLPPFHNTFPFAHPIGDNPADRSCILTPAGGTDAGGSLLSSTDWSVESNECFPSGNVSGHCVVDLAVTLAGKNGIHGTIHAAAPTWIGSHVILPQETLDPGCVIETIHSQYIEDNFMDVRTQAMVDAECCLAPGGTDITVTVVDAIGNVAILVIPVI